MPVFFDISRYLRDNQFDIVWGYHPARDPPQMDPQEQIFLTAQTRVPGFYDISRYLNRQYFNRVPTT